MMHQTKMRPASFVLLVLASIIANANIVRAFGSQGHGTLSLFSTPSSRIQLSSSPNDDSVETKKTGEISRRRAFSEAISASFLTYNLLTNPSPATAASSPPKTILITGCNSGIGFDAASRMALKGNNVILACRTLEKAERSADRIREMAAIGGASIGELTPMECDLSSVASMTAFVNGIKRDGAFLDVACWNAGLARDVAAKEVARTKEGFELTVGTNHLGHFYLNHLVLPMMKPKTGRIVVTASGVHDPESPGGAQGSLATLGNLSGLEHGPMFDMVDGQAFDPDKAYKDSKLCNVLFTRELQRRLNDAGTGIKVNCFNPGLIVGTGLFRDQNPIFTKIFDVAATKLLKVGENAHWGGGALEYMALGDILNQGGLYYSSPPGSSKYGDDAFGNQFINSEVSKEARDDAKAKKLWDLSANLLGVQA